MRLTIVDVFAERRYEGNPLAVVRDAAGLDADTMQAIAREMNLSETTFVLSESASRARVRIFTPARELPFAGHPTLGTAWVLGRTSKRFTLELGVGPVEVELDGEGGVCWMAPPEARFTPFDDRDRAAGVVSLGRDALHPEWQPAFADLGPKFLFVALRGLEQIKRARLDNDVRLALLAEGRPAEAIFVFAPEGYSRDAHYSARLFFDAIGVREDPATGSANSALASYLRRYRPPPFRAIVEQGFEIARPSRLHLDVAAGTYRVGGKVVLVAEGELR